MAGKKRRRFGSARKLPSGRYQARYYDPDGIRRAAADSFASKREALDWLTVKEAEILRGDWVDPDRGRVPFGTYAQSWIEERPGLRPRTVQLYWWLFGKYLKPTLKDVYLVDIDPARVRRWHRNLVESGVSATMIAKAYRLLRAILMTAVDDELISRNPCRIRGGGSESPAERPVLSVAQVFALADEMPDRLRAMVLVAAFASLRFGEASALERRDVDLRHGAVSVRQSYTEVRGKGLVLGPPKSRAGVRTVSLPASVVAELVEHLAEFVGPEPTAPLFTGPKGALLRRGNFNPLVNWRKAVADVGAEGLHFHDLRHTGNTLAAATKTSTRDLMVRMGHDSEKAAIIYQHASREADQAIAEALEARLRDELRARGGHDNAKKGRKRRRRK